jgi:hypothetical protein
MPPFTCESGRSAGNETKLMLKRSLRDNHGLTLGSWLTIPSTRRRSGHTVDNYGVAFLSIPQPLQLVHSFKSHVRYPVEVVDHCMRYENDGGPLPISFFQTYIPGKRTSKKEDLIS